MTYANGKKRQYSTSLSRHSIIHLAVLIMVAFCPAAFAVEPPSTPQPQDQVNVLVTYYSLRGNTQRFALSVVEGAKRVPNTVVTLKNV